MVIEKIEDVSDILTNYKEGQCNLHLYVKLKNHIIFFHSNHP